MIPQNIQKEHIEKAIEEIDRDGIRKGRHSSTYDLIYNGKSYPPKLIISIANKYANGSELDPNSFGGGKDTEAFKLLESNGFNIKEKSETLTNDEIKEGIQLLCETSTEVDGYYQNDENIVTALNQADKGDLNRCIEYYSSRTGVVIDIRKELIERLIKGEKFTVQTLHELIEKYKRGKETQFRSYKETFSIVFPAITFYGHNKQREFVDSFTQQLISDLGMNEHVKVVSFDYQGVRQQGSDRYWVAIYNKAQENQSKSLQFFFEFYKGKIGYGVYKHEDQSYLKPRENNSPNEFSYKNMLSYFDQSKQLLIDDVPKTKNNKEAFSAWLIKKYGQNSGAVGSYVKAIEILTKILSNELFETTDDTYLNSLYDDLIKEQRNPEGKYYHSDAPSYGSNGFYSASIKSYREFLKQKDNPLANNIEMSFPLNTILYGPPGTGKTYHTVLRAAEIIENRKMNSYEDALATFKANLHDQIEFITFHQNYSYEDFIQGLRPDTENDNQLTFDRKDGIFKVMADKALQNLEDSEKPPVAKRIFEEVFNEFITPLVEGEVEEIEVKMKKVSYFITAITNKSIDFRKASGGTAHTLSIGTLKKMYAAESVLDIQGLASYYLPLLESLLKIGKDSSGKKAEIKRKSYVIIIDEINRANISRVFGELITLIEPDKRSHGAIPMEAKLPSGDLFVVPSNLFIIGTMNTADKSIALLDIALRRRFEFEAMYPKYEIEGQEIYDVDILKKINEQIIKSKGHDFQIGHAYFMGENKDLISRMNKKVIPLLLEYYMNDEKEVKGILQSSGLAIEENSWPLRITGKND
jgi:5-methylcytosine-specific restriction endonuclease McrBC GTP-binding regulatory subunit McrB